MSIEQEEFDAWLAHPITVAMREKAKSISEQLKAKWFAMSWGVNVHEVHKLPFETLAYLKGKSEAFESLYKLEYKNLFQTEEEAIEE